MKKDIDYSNLQFGYYKTDYRYISKYKDGKWDDGVISTDEFVTLNESAAILQYGQQVFEGMKAFRTIDNRVVLFRPDMNADRFYNSALTMCMPPVDKDKFVKAACEVVRANIDDVPPYETGATLYLRPYLFGTNPILGIKPASEYEFRIFACPAGPYFKGDGRMLDLCVSNYDRAAPRGTGGIKAGLNYAMSLRPYMKAHEEGYAENVYLDPATLTYIEETGGANILFVSKDNKIVTPKSDSILPSITRKSLMYVAKHYLNLELEERPIRIDEIDDFTECGLCGTAAVISFVGSITNGEKKTEFNTGPILGKLKDTLLDIQKGRVEAPEGWIVEIK